MDDSCCSRTIKPENYFLILEKKLSLEMHDSMTFLGSCISKFLKQDTQKIHPEENSD